MKKYISLNIILFIVFLAGTILTIFIIGKDIDTSFSRKFIIGYVICLLLYGLFSISLLITNSMKLSWNQIRKRLFTFIIWYILLSIGQILIDYFVYHTEVDIWNYGIPFGVSLGVAFSDLMYWKNKQ